MNKVTELNKSEISAVSGGICCEVTEVTVATVIAVGIVSDIAAFAAIVYYFVLPAKRAADNVAPKQETKQPLATVENVIRSLDTKESSAPNKVVKDDASWL